MDRLLSSPESAECTDDELVRLASLRHCGLLDTPAEAAFDRLADLAAQGCAATVGFLALVDRDRVWYKAGPGLVGLSRPRADDPAAWLVAGDELVVIEDLAADARTAAMTGPDGAPLAGLFAAACVRNGDGSRIGVLGVRDRQPRPLAASPRQILTGLAQLATALIEASTLRAELAAVRDDARRSASVDELTGLLNRRTLLERLDVEVERAHRFHWPLSAVMVDIDGFRAVNERHGHQVGDAVLRAVGGIIRDELRQVDLAGRSGGEEFAIILPGTPLPGALTLADALRQEIASHPHGRDGVQVTASLGVAELTADDEPMALLRHAGEAMACAWRAGGDRVQGAGASA